MANGISAETVEELTHGKCMSGYINYHCRFHLECLLKCIWLGLTMKVWRCEHHQTCANTIFVANNLGFPKRKYSFSNIEETEINARCTRTVRLVEQCLKTQLTLCQSVSDAYSLKFGSFFLAIEPGDTHYIPYNVRTIMKPEEELALLRIDVETAPMQDRCL